MKMAKHFWYLYPETVGLVFFDDSIDYNTKKQMVQPVKLVEEEQPVNEHTKKISVDLKTFKEKKFETFFFRKSPWPCLTQWIFHIIFLT